MPQYDFSNTSPMETSFYSHPSFSEVTAMKFCIWRDSYTRMASQKASKEETLTKLKPITASLARGPSRTVSLSATSPPTKALDMPPSSGTQDR